MLLSYVIAGTLAAKLKTQAKIAAQQAFRTQILFDTDRQLQQAKSKEEMLDITGTQLTRLIECGIVTYVAENGILSEGTLFSEQGIFSEQELLNEKEQNVARWVYEKGKRAGAKTHHFSEAR